MARADYPAGVRFPLAQLSELCLRLDELLRRTNLGIISVPRISPHPLV